MNTQMWPQVTCLVIGLNSQFFSPLASLYHVPRALLFWMLPLNIHRKFLCSSHLLPFIHSNLCQTRCDFDLSPIKDKCWGIVYRMNVYFFLLLTDKSLNKATHLGTMFARFMSNFIIYRIITNLSLTSRHSLR